MLALSRKYTLATIERPFQLGSGIMSCHAYLGMYEETRGPLAEDGVPRRIEEIHFSDVDHSPFMTAFVGAHEYKCDGTSIVTPYLGGEERDILPLWIRWMEVAILTRETQLIFDARKRPDSINCRAGVVTALESVGLEFMPSDHPLRQAGSRRSVYNEIARDLPPLNTGAPLEELRARKEELEILLPDNVR